MLFEIMVDLLNKAMEENEIIIVMEEYWCANFIEAVAFENNIDISADENISTLVRLIDWLME